MIGSPIPAGVQGRSLWPMLTGAEYPKREFDSIYSELGIGDLPYGPGERPELPGELHDLYGDPSHAARKAEMLEALLVWAIRTEDSLPRAKYIPKVARHGWYWLGENAGAGQ